MPLKTTTNETRSAGRGHAEHVGKRSYDLSTAELNAFATAFSEYMRADTIDPPAPTLRSLVENLKQDLLARRSRR